MSENTQPNLQWGPLEQKPQRRGRVWVIVGATVAALVIVGVLLFFLLPRGENSPRPEASTTPSPSATATAMATPTPSVEPEPSMTPITTPPPPVDPTVDVFRGQVQGWLDDAVTGLDIVRRSSPQDAVNVVDSLQDDAQRLSETVPPSSVAPQWSDALGAYAQRLSTLSTAANSGSGMADAVDATSAALRDLRSTIGL